MEEPPGIYGYEFRHRLTDRLSEDRLAAMSRLLRDFRPEIIQGAFWRNFRPWFVPRRRVGDEFCVFVCSGRLRVELDDETRELERGDCLLLPERTPHAFGLPPGVDEVSHVIIHVHAEEEFRQLASPFHRLPGPESLLERLQDMVTLMEYEPARGRDYAVALLREVLLGLARDGTWGMADVAPGDSRIALALCFLRDNYTANIGVADLAASCGLHQVRFRELFRHETGLTPAAALLRQRLRVACRLLSFSGLRVRQIAADCGFGSEYYFCSVFKKMMGCRPSEYRARSGS